MTSSRPYLLRALYDWILDNSMTPHLVVDATVGGAQVPTEHIRDGQVILNIVPTAVRNLQLDNDAVSFSARFSGKAREIYVPMQAVLAIYARENGKGLIFPEDEDMDNDREEETAGTDRGRPHLTVIK